MHHITTFGDAPHPTLPRPGCAWAPPCSQKWADSQSKCCCLRRPCCSNPFKSCAYDWSCNNGCCGNCPAGYTDMGCTCYRAPEYYIKATYGRGAGKPLTCTPTQQYDSGLCYTPCRSGYDSVGPLCWRNNCPADLPYSCGRGVCTNTKATCDVYASMIGVTAATMVGGIAICVFSAGTACGVGSAMIEMGVDFAIGSGQMISGSC